MGGLLFCEGKQRSNGSRGREEVEGAGGGAEGRMPLDVSYKRRIKKEKERQNNRNKRGS